MKYFVLFTLFFTLPSLAEDYERGDLSCNIEEAKQAYEEDPEFVSYQLYYGLCFIIKGEATGDESLTTRGISLLYRFSKEKKNILASYFLAYYYRTGRTFKSFTLKYLDESLEYYLHTLATIKTFNLYPDNTYLIWENDFHMEQVSSYKIPELYLKRYRLGVKGDYRKNLLESPSYEGERDLKTYLDYRENLSGTLDQAMYHINKCLSLPKKNHFDLKLYDIYKENCRILKDLVLEIKDLEVKRRNILLQDNCQDLNESNCPEFFEVYSKILENSRTTLETANNNLTGYNSNF